MPVQASSKPPFETGGELPRYMVEATHMKLAVCCRDVVILSTRVAEGLVVHLEHRDEQC